MNTSSPNLGLILGSVALLVALYCLWQTFSINKLRKTFFAGSGAGDLESIILALKEELKDSRNHQAVLEANLLELRQSSTYALQKLGLVRFNPFSDGGGNFSFSLAILDAHNSGTIITSMYGREQNRIYTKKITGGKADSQLTEEELQAINLANSKM